MIRPTRALCTAYGTLIAFLAYCAVNSFRNAAPWHACAFITASGLVVAAIIREGELEDALRREAIRAERDARMYGRPADNGVAAVALAAACCEGWWVSAGTEHDPTCPRRTPRSSAA